MNPFKKSTPKESEATAPQAAPEAAAAAPEGQQGETQNGHAPVDPRQDPNMVRILDPQGREHFIPRETVRTEILPKSIEAAWNDADRLHMTVVTATQDGFAADVLAAARHLAEIDTVEGRAQATLGIVLIEAGQAAEAEVVIAELIAKKGEDSGMLTHLARAQGLQGKEDDASKTLWRALELDPNNDNALRIYVSITRKQKDIPAALEALKSIDALPGSWRAKLWLADDAFERKDNAAAVGLYKAALAAVTPMPPDGLMQISGSLGGHGLIDEIFNIVLPAYRVDIHGLAVGSNLLKAFIDKGRIGDAIQLIEALYSLQRPEFREPLQQWQDQVDNILFQAVAKEQEKMKVELAIAPIIGPVWAREKEGFSALLPEKPADAPGIAILAPTVTQKASESADGTQREGQEGVISRALALYLAEQVHLRTTANGIAMFPQVAGREGFILSNQPYTNSDAIKLVGNAATACPIIVNAHIDASRTEWTITLKLLNAAGKLMKTLYTVFTPEKPEFSFEKLAKELVEQALATEGVKSQEVPEWYKTPEAGRWPMQLFARTQVLIYLLSSDSDLARTLLYRNRMLMDGLFMLAVQENLDPVCRMMLLTVLARHQAIGAGAFMEYGMRVRQLHHQRPVEGKTAEAIAAIVDRLYPLPPQQPEGEAPAAAPETK